MHMSFFIFLTHPKAVLKYFMIFVLSGAKFEQLSCSRILNMILYGTGETRN